MRLMIAKYEFLRQTINYNITAAIGGQMYLYSVQRMVSNVRSVFNLLRIPFAPVPPCAAMAF